MNSLLIERGNRQKKDKNFRLPDNIFHFLTSMVKLGKKRIFKEKITFFKVTSYY